MTDSDHVTLFRRKTPRAFWLVDAKIDQRGDLIVTSGDAHREWVLTVKQDQLAALKQILSTVQTDPSLGLLGLLEARFGREKVNPFEDIKSLLETNEIAFKTTVW
ncbi:MAG: hypothetical protein AAGA12_05230 [Pseudomonadota bacterium]